MAWWTAVDIKLTRRDASPSYQKNQSSLQSKNPQGCAFTLGGRKDPMLPSENLDESDFKVVIPDQATLN